MSEVKISQLEQFHDTYITLSEKLKYKDTDRVLVIWLRKGCSKFNKELKEKFSVEKLKGFDLHLKW